MLAEALEAEHHLAADLIVHHARHADSTDLREALDPGGDVHVVPIDLLTLDQDLAQVDTDAKLHPPLLGKLRIPGGQVLLEHHGALDRVDNTAELRQQAVACEVDDPATVAADEPRHQLTVGLDHFDRGRLVVAHEPAVAVNVGAQDSRQPSFEGGRCVIHRRLASLMLPVRAALQPGLKKLRDSLLVFDLDLVSLNVLAVFLEVLAVVLVVFVVVFLVFVVSEFIFLELEVRKPLAMLGAFGSERFLCIKESPDRLLPGLGCGHVPPPG